MSTVMIERDEDRRIHLEPLLHPCVVELVELVELTVRARIGATSTSTRADSFDP
ncbi:hypothetical protein [Amycolatopsis sp. PS_44_ISF1]|uniref:hypothetical protein n=1 Tax=Amycolatopsis sp. PS_44_ISF1 TaxID=2974917 RepID=UPI0028DF7CAC|nr:hypothetical protein [Amycolatopsis sp. PS_44_ISF1]MDT8916055.1 hypothetical protein [Amycolatopsis sp. PS_44_ISF1]